MGITYEELKKLKGNSLVFEKQESIKIEQNSDNFIRRKRTIIRERFGRNEKGKSYSKDSIGKAKKSKQRAEIYAKERGKESGGKAKKSKQRAKEITNESDDERETNELLDFLNSGREEHTKFEQKLDDTSQQLQQLDEVIQHEIDNLKFGDKLLKMEMELQAKKTKKKKKQRGENPNMVPENPNTTWAENLNKNNKEKFQEITVEKYSPQYKGICVSPRIAANEDMAIRPKMRTVGSQMETPIVYNDKGARGDHNSVNILHPKNEEDMSVKELLLKPCHSIINPNDQLVYCGCLRICQHYNKMIRNCNGLICNHHSYRETQVQPHCEYNYCRDEYYSGYPKCMQHTNSRPTAHYGNSFQQSAPNYGRQHTDLNTEHFYCAKSNDPKSKERNNSTENPEKSETKLAENEKKLLYEKLQNDSKFIELLDHFANENDKRLQRLIEKSKVSKKQQNREEPSSSTATTFRVTSTEKIRQMTVKKKHISPRSVTSNRRDTTDGYDDNPTPVSQYSVETREMLKQMKIKEYKPVKSNDEGKEKSKKTKEVKKVTREQLEMLEKYMRYVEYIEKYEKENGESMEKALKATKYSFQEQLQTSKPPSESSRDETILAKNQTQILRNDSPSFRDQPTNLEEEILISKPQLPTSTHRPQTSREQPQISELPIETLRDQKTLHKNQTQIFNKETQDSENQFQRYKLQPQMSRYRLQASRDRPQTQVFRKDTQQSRYQSQVSEDQTHRQPFSRDQPQISEQPIEISRDHRILHKNQTEIFKNETQDSANELHKTKLQPQMSRDRLQASRDRPQTSSKQPQICQDKTQIFRNDTQQSRYESQIPKDQTHWPPFSRDQSPIYEQPIETLRDHRILHKNQTEIFKNETQDSANELQKTKLQPQMSRDRLQASRDRPQTSSKQTQICQDETQIFRYDTPQSRYPSQVSENQTHRQQFSRDQPQISEQPIETSRDHRILHKNQTEIFKNETEDSANELQKTKLQPQMSSDRLQVSRDRPQISCKQPQISPHQTQIFRNDTQQSRYQSQVTKDQIHISKYQSKPSKEQPQTSQRQSSRYRQPITDQLQMLKDQKPTLNPQSEIFQDETHHSRYQAEQTTDRSQYSKDQSQISIVPSKYQSKSSKEAAKLSNEPIENYQRPLSQCSLHQSPRMRPQTPRDQSQIRRSFAEATRDAVLEKFHQSTQTSKRQSSRHRSQASRNPLLDTRYKSQISDDYKSTTASSQPQISRNPTKATRDQLQTLNDPTTSQHRQSIYRPHIAGAQPQISRYSPQATTDQHQISPIQPQILRDPRNTQSQTLRNQTRISRDLRNKDKIKSNDTYIEYRQEYAPTQDDAWDNYDDLNHKTPMKYETPKQQREFKTEPTEVEEWNDYYETGEDYDDEGQGKYEKYLDQELRKQNRSKNDLDYDQYQKPLLPEGRQYYDSDQTKSLNDPGRRHSESMQRGFPTDDQARSVPSHYYHPQIRDPEDRPYSKISYPIEIQMELDKDYDETQFLNQYQKRRPKEYFQQYDNFVSNRNRDSNAQITDLESTRTFSNSKDSHTPKLEDVREDYYKNSSKYPLSSTIYSKNNPKNKTIYSQESKGRDITQMKEEITTKDTFGPPQNSRNIQENLLQWNRQGSCSEVDFGPPQKSINIKENLSQVTPQESCITFTISKPSPRIKQRGTEATSQKPYYTNSSFSPNVYSKNIQKLDEIYGQENSDIQLSNDEINGKNCGPSKTSKNTIDTEYRSIYNTSNTNYSMLEQNSKINYTQNEDGFEVIQVNEKITTNIRTGPPQKTENIEECKLQKQFSNEITQLNAKITTNINTVPPQRFKNTAKYEHPLICTTLNTSLSPRSSPRSKNTTENECPLMSTTIKTSLTSRSSQGSKNTAENESPLICATINTNINTGPPQISKNSAENECPLVCNSWEQNENVRYMPTNENLEFIQVNEEISQQETIGPPQKSINKDGTIDSQLINDEMITETFGPPQLSVNTTEYTNYFEWKQKFKAKYAREHDFSEITQANEGTTTKATIGQYQTSTNTEVTNDSQTINDEMSNETFGPPQIHVNTVEHSTYSKLKFKINATYSQNNDGTKSSQVNEGISADKIIGPPQISANNDDKQIIINEITNKTFGPPQRSINNLEDEFSSTFITSHTVTSQLEPKPKISYTPNYESTEVAQVNEAFSTNETIGPPQIPTNTKEEHSIKSENSIKTQKEEIIHNKQQQATVSEVEISGTHSQNSSNSQRINKEEISAQNTISEECQPKVSPYTEEHKSEIQQYLENPSKIQIQVLPPNDCHDLYEYEDGIYYEQSHIQPQYWDTLKDYEKYTEYQGNMAHLPQSQSMVEYSMSPKTNPNQHENNDPNSSLDNEYLSPTETNDYEFHDLPECSSTMYNCVNFSRSHRAAQPSNDRTFSQFPNKLPHEATSLPLKGILKPYHVDESNTATEYEVETYRTCSLVNFGLKERINNQGATDLTYTLDQERKTHHSNENIDTIMTNDETECNHQSSKSRQCGSIQEVPDFTHCPCMLGTYLELLHEYYREEDKSKLNRNRSRSPKN